VRRIIVALIPLPFLGLTTLGDNAGAQQSPPASKEQLVGTWMLVKWWNSVGETPRRSAFFKKSLNIHRK
jgi:hypothetical protein